MQSQKKTPTEQLQLLMYQFDNSLKTPESLANFKKHAMVLAENGADLAARDEGSLGGTLLHHLVRTNKDGVNTNEIIRLFAINERNINKIKDFASITNKNGYTALQDIMYFINNNLRTLSTLNDFKKTAMLLAEHGANLEDRDDSLSGRTLLHHLVCTNENDVNTQQIIRLFEINNKSIKKIEKFANIKSGSGNTALQDLMYYFNNKLCTTNDFKKSAMLLAENGANLDDRDDTLSGRTLLHHLVFKNDDGVNTKEIIRLFEINNNNITKIDNFANIKSGAGDTALQDLMYYLVNYFCTLEDFKKTAMVLAENQADLTVIGPIASKATVLHLLVLNSKDNFDDPEIKEILKLDDKLIDVRDGFGRTPLQALIRAKINVPVTVENVEKLVLLKSNLQTRADNGETLLHSACFSGNLKVAQYLVSKGLELGAKTKLDGTMFHAACGGSNAELCQWLSDNNIDINAQNKEGRTALHFAVKMNNIAMVKWLIEKKVNLELKDNDQKTALDIAQENKLTKIADLLIKAGAKQNIVMKKNDPFKNIFDISQDLKKIIENNSVTNNSGSSSNTKQPHVNEPQANNQPLPKENQTKTEPSNNDESNTQLLKSYLNRLAQLTQSCMQFKSICSLITERVEQNIDLSVDDDTILKNTLLHHLVRTNKNRCNDALMIKILKLRPDLVKVKNASGQTALQLLLNQFSDGVCDLVDFKRSGMILAKFGADLTETDVLLTPLMVHLIFTNSNGQNNDEIRMLNGNVNDIVIEEEGIYKKDKNEKIDKKIKISKSSRVERLLDEPISQSDNKEFNESPILLSDTMLNQIIAQNQNKTIDGSATQPSSNNESHDNDQSEQNEETIQVMLDSILQIPDQNNANEDIIAACQQIYDEGKQLMYEIISDSNDNDTVINPGNCLEIKELKKSLKLALKVLQPGVDEHAINELKDHAMSLDGKPSFWKKFIGALLTLAGAVAIGLGISTVVPSGGLSIAACAGGSALMATGVTFFYSGRHKGLSRGMSDLAETVENCQPNLRI